MRKRIISVLLAVIMLIGVAIPTSAAAKSEDGQSSQGFYGHYEYDSDNHRNKPSWFVIWDKENNIYDDPVTIKDIFFEIIINGTDFEFNVKSFGEMKTYTGSFHTVDGLEMIGNLDCDEDGFIKIYCASGTQPFHLYFEDDRYIYATCGEWVFLREKVKEPSDPQDYHANIVGNGISNVNEYMVSIIGQLKGTFSEGVNVLTYADVQAQNFSINIMNLTNGASRVMTISTVESITVTITSGAISNVEVKGRAQTTPGNFDRYTINCNVL